MTKMIRWTALLALVTLVVCGSAQTASADAGIPSFTRHDLANAKTLIATVGFGETAWVRCSLEQRWKRRVTCRSYVKPLTRNRYFHETHVWQAFEGGIMLTYAREGRRKLVALVADISPKSFLIEQVLS